MSNRSEYRIVLPMSVEEYQVAQLYSVAQASKNETGGGEGIEVKKNQHFTIKDDFKDLSTPNVVIDDKKLDLPEEGQYTHKIYHLASRVPKFIKLIAPTGSLEIHEKAWNMYPYCRTIITNPDYMKEGFFIKIETLHLPGRGKEENVHGLDAKAWGKTDVVHIDIANDPTASRDYKPEWDPQLVKSQKSGRGPLKGNWKETAEPVMCCYKLVTVCFKWFGLQNKVENFIQKQERRIFFNFHRQVFCWMDEWYGLTMEDIRRIEEETKKS